MEREDTLSANVPPNNGGADYLLDVEDPNKGSEDLVKNAGENEGSLTNVREERYSPDTDWDIAVIIQVFPKHEECPKRVPWTFDLSRFDPRLLCGV